MPAGNVVHRLGQNSRKGGGAPCTQALDIFHRAAEMLFHVHVPTQVPAAAASEAPIRDKWLQCLMEVMNLYEKGDHVGMLVTVAPLHKQMEPKDAQELQHTALDREFLQVCFLSTIDDL